MKDRRRRPEGGEWEPIKILLENLAYIPKSTRHPSLLTRPRPHSYSTAVGPQNRARNCSDKLAGADCGDRPNNKNGTAALNRNTKWETKICKPKYVNRKPKYLNRKPKYLHRGRNIWRQNRNSFLNNRNSFLNNRNMESEENSATKSSRKEVLGTDGNR
jgi:hypothetical protein